MSWFSLRTISIPTWTWTSWLKVTAIQKPKMKAHRAKEALLKGEKNKLADIKFPSFTSCIVFADKAMMHTVFRNLIINAIKFSFPGGRIIISSDNTC